VLISDRIRRAYAHSRGIEDRTHVVRNWVDVTPFDATHDRAAVCTHHKVPPERFTFMYLGNLSALSALDTAIRAFARVAAPGNQLVIVGEGSTKAGCQALVHSLGLTNVHFRSEPDPNRVAWVQTMADVCLLPMRKGGAVSSTPSKCISYMLSSKPILAAADAESDLADDLQTAQCGWVCPPENEAHMATAMRAAQEAPAAVRDAMGAGGNAYARHHFSRDACLPRIAAVIEAACQSPH
jgi:colanic acid biosynthesis glycosyl transferase WcaI